MVCYTFLFIFVSIYFNKCPFVCVRSSDHPYISPSVRLSVCLSVCLFVCLFVCLSVLLYPYDITIIDIQVTYNNNHFSKTNKTNIVLYCLFILLILSIH